MIFLQETTDWGSHSAVNHIYCLDDKKEFMLAYIRMPITEPKVFKNPIRFDMRGRTFTQLKSVKPAKNLVKFAGSKGAVYYVDPEDNSCSCPGYKYRGECKHVAEIQQKKP